MDMRTVLLLSISETIPQGHEPFLRQLASLGWRAVICATHVAPALVARSWRVHCLDPSDAGTVIEALAGLRVDAVLPLGDESVAVAAQLGEAWGLPHAAASACDVCSSKASLKQRLLASGVPTPAFQHSTVKALIGGCDQATLRAPWIIKPAHTTGGSAGVFAAASDEELVEGLRLHKAHYRSGEVVIEPLLTGSEHSMEVIVQAGRARILSISDKVNYQGHPSVVQSLQFPGPIGWKHRNTIQPVVERLPVALGLSEAVMHIEVLLSEAGPFVIDLSLRPGGSYNLHPIAQLSTGWDYVAMLLALFSGERTLPARGSPMGCLAWHFFDSQRLASDAGQRIHGLRSQPDVIAAELLHDRQPPRPLLQDGDRPGFVLVLGQENSWVMQRAETLAESLYH